VKILWASKQTEQGRKAELLKLVNGRKGELEKGVQSITSHSFQIGKNKIKRHRIENLSAWGLFDPFPRQEPSV